MGIDLEKIEQAVHMIIEAIGEDPSREGLIDTPKRVARMYAEVFAGLDTDPSRHLKVQFTEEEHEEMVIVKDIPVYSMCEHHLIPFYGKAHVAYIPRKGKITGLSKFARVVDEFARRPQLQERLTSQIANAVMDELSPLGVLVVIEAEHMCMTMRGVKKAGAQTVTSAVRGIFNKNPVTRSEAFSMIQRHRL